MSSNIIVEKVEYIRYDTGMGTTYTEYNMKIVLNNYWVEIFNGNGYQKSIPFHRVLEGKRK